MTHAYIRTALPATPSPHRFHIAIDDSIQQRLEEELAAAGLLATPGKPARCERPGAHRPRRTPLRGRVGAWSKAHILDQGSKSTPMRLPPPPMVPTQAAGP